MCLFPVRRIVIRTVPGDNRHHHECHNRSRRYPPRRTPQARDSRRGTVQPRRSRALRHRCVDLSGRTIRRDRAAGDRRRRRGTVDRARGGYPGAAARRRHQPMRPDGEPRTGDRLLEASAPHPGHRSGGAHGIGGTRPGAGSSERGAAPAWAVLPGRSLDACALHDRRHGRQQLLRLEVDPLRADGRQRARDRCDPGGWHAAQIRPAARQYRRPCAERHRRSDPAAARIGCGGSGGDRRALSLPASARRRLQHRGADAGGTPCRRGEPRAPAGGIGGHPRLLRRDRACALSDQAAKTARHLPVPDLPQRDGGGAAHRATRSRGGGTGGSHHDRPRPRHPDLPRHDRPHADRRAGLAADRGVPRPRGCAARGKARRT